MNIRFAALFRTVTMFCFISPAALLLAGGVCAESAPDMKRHFEESIVRSGEKKLFNVEVMVKGNELRPGTNRAELVVYDSAGNDVEGAVVTVEPLNKAQEQIAGGEAVMSDKGAGFYSADNIVLESAGHWILRITVSKDGAEDKVDIDFPEVKGIGEDTVTGPAAETAEGEKPAEGVLAGPVTDTPSAENLTVVVSAFGKYREMLAPLPAIAPIPADNPMTMSKVQLGRMLFWDRRVSKTGAASCAACHSPSHYGAEPMRKSVWPGGEVRMRNAPTVLNAAFLSSLYWTGESPDLEHLAVSEIESGVAMGGVPEEAAERLNSIPEYKAISSEVFGGPLTGENTVAALAAYMRTLITPNYPLARWIQGDEYALTENQKKGMALFIDKGCIGCHYGPVFSGPVHDRGADVYAPEHSEARELGIHLHKILLPGAEDDAGLAESTGQDKDKYYFRVPLLLNVTKTPPYTHAGLIDSLNDVVKFMAVNMLNTDLSQSESDDIVAFLDSLTGEVPEHFMTAPALPAGGVAGDFGPGPFPSGHD